MSEQALEHIERRHPVLNIQSAEQFPQDEIDFQWRLITETIRREVLSNQDTREIVRDFVATPVNELLPFELLSKLSGNVRIHKLLERYQDQITSYLQLEPVSDDEIIPDITHAGVLVEPEGVVNRLQNLYGENTPEYTQRLQRYIDSDIFLHGLTREEKILIAQRYRFARDVKLLALQADILEQDESFFNNPDREINLPSGVSITVNVDSIEERLDLLNPQLWEKRTQLKDRVYELDINHSKYILKEKKTSRHTDTKKHGHREGLTSLEEYQVAKYLQDQATIEQDDISVKWELPLSSVVFPDGFQFTIFDYEEGLIEDKLVVLQLAEEIMVNREHYEMEYEEVRQMAGKYKDNPVVVALASGGTNSKVRTFLSRIEFRKSKEFELSFEEFARAKALRMKAQAKELMEETIIRNGYSNSDFDGYAYKIITGSEAPQLEIFGFDFEYMTETDGETIEQDLENYRVFIQDWEVKCGFPSNWNDETTTTRMEKAAYFTMLEMEGII